MKRLFRTQSPARLIALGFAMVILLGSVLLLYQERYTPAAVLFGASIACKSA